jgi:hypothetical protein
MDDSTDMRTSKTEDDAPEAPEGMGHPVRPDGDDEVEGHGRQNPELPDDGDEDVEGHSGHIGG